MRGIWGSYRWGAEGKIWPKWAYYRWGPTLSTLIHILGGYASPPVSHTDARQNAHLEPCLFRPDRALAGANPQASAVNRRKPPPAPGRSAGRTSIFRSSLPRLVAERYFSVAHQASPTTSAHQAFATSRGKIFFRSSLPGLIPERYFSVAYHQPRRTKHPLNVSFLDTSKCPCPKNEFNIILILSSSSRASPRVGRPKVEHGRA